MKPKCGPEKPKSIPTTVKPTPKKRMGSKFKMYQDRMEKGPGE